MGIPHIDQAGLELLTSSYPPTWASQSAGITRQAFESGAASYDILQLIFYDLHILYPLFNGVVFFL